MTLTKQASIAVEAQNTTRINNHHNRRILFLSLEFNYAPFSGNGVLCRSLVCGLLKDIDNDSTTNKNGMEIRVICAKPHPSTPNLSQDINVSHKSLEIWPVQLQRLSSSCHQWKRLDRLGPWKEFASALTCQDGTTSTNNNDNDNDDINLRECIEQFDPTDVVAVDWHGMLAWQAFCSTTTTAAKHLTPPKVNICYYNFRVYSSSSWGNNGQKDSDNDDNIPDENQFYKEMEQLACRLADDIICLSEHDRRALHNLMLLQQEDDDDDDEEVVNKDETKIREITILPPPLRGDVCNLARMMDDQQLMDNKGGISDIFSMYLPEETRKALDYVHQQQKQQGISTIPKQRLFITCISRLSPEKSPHIFVNLLQQLGGVDFLRRYCLVPILCGARSVDSYADEVIQSFKSVCSTTGDYDDGSYWPCIIIDHHLGPKELAAIFSHTVLNVHPCLYDAYGMTLVESAAFGVPSVVNCGGKVGAAALLGENEGCVALDLSGMEEEEITTAETADKLKEMLLPRIRHTDTDSPEKSCSTHLDRIAKKARHQALGWDESSCCRGLMEKLNSLNNAD